MMTHRSDHHVADARRTITASYLAFLMLALSGCASVTPQGSQSLDVEVPASWSGVDVPSTVSAESLAQWWRHFDDPMLGALVTQAMRTNTSVENAQAVLQQARALRDLAAAALWPTLNGSASAQRGSAGGHSTGSILQAGVNANWLPDVFGANRSALDASVATVEAKFASLGDTQVGIAAEVGLNYILLRSAQARLAIASDNLASQQETLQITQWRQQAGLVTSIEAEQARAAVEQTRALLPTLQTSIDQTRHSLAVLTGQPPAALSSLLAATRPVPQANDDLALSIPAETLRQRADVRAAEYLVTAARARVEQADAARFPSFALGGSIGLNAATLGTLSNGASVVSALLASATLPIFDGGAARAQVRSQQAALEQARVAYKTTVLTALKEVEDALIALRSDRQRLLSLRDAADAAGNAAQMARQRFSSGLVDFQIVLETQRTQFATQDGVASASADVSADYVRLFKALGGGWRAETTSTAMAPVTGPSAAAAEQVTRTSIP